MGDIPSAALEGLLTLFTFDVFPFMLIGIFVGMFFGLVPGLSGLSGMGLLLPFAIGQSPEVAFAFLLGMYSVTTQTDSIPAILIGVPGTAAAQATYLDGYPMAKRGEAGRALSASYFASIFGTLVSIAIFIIFLPILRPAIDRFESPEFFMLSMWGLFMVGSLSGTSVLRGLTAMGLGLMISMIGFAPNTDYPRYVFDWHYLSDGLPLIPMALGLFAVPEVVDLMLKRGGISNSGSASGGVLKGARDVIDNWWLVFKCGVIGAICGMIPGLGGVVAEWFGYGHAVQTAKDPSQFGKGDVRGVIAPETATAAQKPGAVLPTVAFGIPGNAAMALLLGVFLIVGLRPGPEMLNEKLPLTFQMTWTVVVANIIAAGLALLLQKYLVKLCYVRATIIAPIILCFMAVGASLATNEFDDLLVFGIFGLIGYLFKHGDWPRVPLLIGLVLGTLAEVNLFITVSLYDTAWLWNRPIVLTIEALILISILFPVVRKRMGSRRILPRTGSSSTGDVE
jgi:putative tricarboxylic transport membrane protein